MMDKLWPNFTGTVFIRVMRESLIYETLWNLITFTSLEIIHRFCEKPEFFLRRVQENNSTKSCFPTFPAPPGEHSDKPFSQLKKSTISESNPKNRSNHIM